MKMEPVPSITETNVQMGASCYPTEEGMSELIKAECFSRPLEKPTQFKPTVEEMCNIGSRRKRKESRDRNLTDEVVEEYRLLIVDSNSLHRQFYEEAAFKVYGTLPPGKGSFTAALKNMAGKKI